MAALKDARRLVVKIGSALLVDADTGGLRQTWLRSLADDVARLRTRGVDVILVSSGSIALGRRLLKLGSGTLALEQAQAAAAVGQIQLARAYEEALGAHGILTAQVLVTLEDSSDRRRYLNSRATLQTLLTLETVPIVNENDTVATDEIRFGDNDRLAAQVAVTVEADQLVLLSDVDGFYSANPVTDPAARRFDVIDQITPQIEAMAGDPVSGMSKGGMKTKLMAAKTATASGCAMAITHGFADAPLLRLETGGPATWFTAQIDPHVARKRWIAAMKPMGVLEIDDGAVAALARGNSLLPAGVQAVKGRFGRGEPVEIVDAAGYTIGQGLCRYTAEEAVQIQGARSDQIETILGSSVRSAMVHRDDMAFS